MTDREKFLAQARKYIGLSGNYVCNTKLRLGLICDWCAYSISAIMKDCGFIGKYQGGIYGYASDAAREDSGKLGEWFRKGEKVPQPGDYIMFRYASFTTPIDKFSASHVGIIEGVNGNILTTLEGNVDGYGYNWAATSSFKRKTRDLSSHDVYAFYRPFWQGEDKAKTTATSSGTDRGKNIDAIYQVHTIGGTWLPNVKNTDDFAGVESRPVDGIKLNLGNGHVRYRVHLIGGSWLPWVTDRTDYAGIYGRKIDGVQIELIGNKEQFVEYRVSTTGSNEYLPWVRDYNNTNDDGYAGILGKSIDKLQVRIK